VTHQYPAHPRRVRPESHRGRSLPTAADFRLDPGGAGQYRKEQLAAGFRLFGRFGFSEGVAGHITVRDPENPEWSG